MASHDRLSPVRIEPGMYADLRQAAERAGHSITEEVRQRLGTSFERDAAATRDPKLAALQRRIGELAAQLQLDVDAPWHANAFAFVAFRAGVLCLLDEDQPEGEPTPPKGTGRMIGGDDPETLGRAFARLVLRS